MNKRTKRTIWVLGIAMMVGVCLVAVQPAWAAIAFDAASEGHNTSSSEVTSLTVSHTVVSNTNGILVVGVNMLDTTYPFPTVSTMTYAGQSMTFIARLKQPNDATARVSSELWYIKAPATGANNIVITFSASVRGVVAGGMSYTGVDQTTPLGTPANAVCSKPGLDMDKGGH